MSIDSAPKGTVAFWVKGDEILENSESHVRVVSRNPEKFGLAPGELFEPARQELLANRSRRRKRV